MTQLFFLVTVFWPLSLSLSHGFEYFGCVVLDDYDDDDNDGNYGDDDDEFIVVFFAYSVGRV